MEHQEKYWSGCTACRGQGKKLQGPSKRRRRCYEKELRSFDQGGKGRPPSVPQQSLDICTNCNGSGLSQVMETVGINLNYPHISIVGGGIGGVALAVACSHRGIPYTLYERDRSFNARSQGYGLTLQQASKAMYAFGIESLPQGIISTKHTVLNEKGIVLGEWGLRKWIKGDIPQNDKRKNIHIARQSLRERLLAQVPADNAIQWGYELIDIKNHNSGNILYFQTSEGIQEVESTVVVGADGIRSKVRSIILDQSQTSLNYLGCIVVLGICRINDVESAFVQGLDAKTVFQMVDAHARVYVMPYDAHHLMWQFSVPMDEVEALGLNKKGARAMKEKVFSYIATWTKPVPDIIAATDPKDITGYPAYDRDTLDGDLLNSKEGVTLIGDAAHPMSPFKGQGANQALLDALSLARHITHYCDNSDKREISTYTQGIISFEKEMIQRTTKKVVDSRAAAKLLHSRSVLLKKDGPRK